MEKKKAEIYLKMQELELKKKRTIRCSVQEITGITTYLIEPLPSGEGEVSTTRYSTLVREEDGSTITVSMNIADSLKLKPENIDTMFWDVPCRNGGNSAPRTLRQVQDCRCNVCQAACATILKWRMMK
jgi:hypothetical protein